MKKFLSTILTISILALPVGLQCLASENGGNERSYLVENEDAIKRDLKDLTGFETTDLLYRASRDGFNPDNFYEKCEGKSNTVVVVKVKDGDLIGGYVSIPWFEFDVVYDDVNRDENAFLFSLTQKKLYPIKSTKCDYAIYNFLANECGPVFGAVDKYGNDLRIIDADETGLWEYCDENELDPDDAEAIEEFSKETKRSSCCLGMPGGVYESNGDDCGTFLGLESSKSKVYFGIEDYEVYEVENTVANNSVCVCGGHTRKARVNIEDGSACWSNSKHIHDEIPIKRKTNGNDETENNEKIENSGDSEDGGFINYIDYD